MDPTPPVLEPAPPTASAPPTSLAARLLNVFAVPGDVFDEIKTAAHSAANWVVTAILGGAVGVVAVIIVLSQPAIVQKMREQQDQAIEKRLEKQVKEGKLTQQQVEQQKEMAGKILSPTVMKITGSVAAVGWSFARVFLWALVLWLIGRWMLKAQFPYLKAAEVVGLAAMIGVLGTIVKLLLQVNFSNPAASPSLAMVVREVDPKNPMHLLLGALNLFDFWELTVMAVGVARLAGVPFVRAAFPVFGFWILFMSVMISISAALVRLFG